MFEAPRLLSFLTPFVFLVPPYAAFCQQAAINSSHTSTSTSRSSHAYGFVRPRSTTAISESSIRASVVHAIPACSDPDPQISTPVEYRAYIPLDNVTGSNSLACTGSTMNATALYYGDNPQNGANVTYRASVYTLVSPFGIGSPGGDISNTVNDTGITYQFNNAAPYASPVIPPFLSSGDYDGVLGDCKYENGQDQAQFGSGSNYSGVSGITTSDTVGGVTFNGEVSNPLASSQLTIGWNLTTTITDLDSSTINAQVSGGVTCFPASEIIINGQIEASYIPTSSSTMYIAACLVGPDNTPLSGPAAAPGGVNISN